MAGLWIYVFSAVMACWFVFAAAFLFRKRPPKSAETKRAPAAVAGLALQSIAYSVVWMGRADYKKPRIPGGFWSSLALGLCTVILAVVSVWMVMAAVRRLGKQWALKARIIEGHELVTDGPYRFVRHPIYSGMFGMLAATGLSMSSWPALLAGVVVFWAGTVLRVKQEEILLKQVFGDKFEQYAARTGSLFPRLSAGRKAGI